MIAWLRNKLSQIFTQEPTRAVPVPAAPAKRSRDRSPAPAKKAVPKRGRPVSDSLTRTVERLRIQPEVTAVELSALLKVSKDYARTLLRRARAKIAEEKIAAAPPPPRKRRKTSAPEAPRETLVSFPAQSLNLNRRAQVLRRIQGGESPHEVAAAVGIPPGEVDFIVKVDRMLNAAF